MNTSRPRNALAFHAHHRTGAGPMRDRRAPRGGASSTRGACCPACGGETYGGDLVCLNTACDAD